MLEDDVCTRHHVKTGGDHRRGMNQRRHRSWAGHGIGQPNVQRQLRRFSASAYKKTKRNPGQDAPVAEQLERITFGLSKDVGVLGGAKSSDHSKDCERKSKVANAVSNECFP